MATAGDDKASAASAASTGYIGRVLPQDLEEGRSSATDLKALFYSNINGLYQYIAKSVLL